MDFRLLKAKTQAILDNLDHRYLNELPFSRGTNPSSENLAAYIFAEISRQVDQGSRRVSWVSVWESETSRATYRQGPKNDRYSESDGTTAAWKSIRLG